MKSCLLVQSCDKYAPFWEGWYLTFKKHWTLDVPVYFVSETKRVFWEGVNFILTGEKQWSDQLICALDKIPENTIIYLTEDLYFTGGMPDWTGLLYDFNELKIDCLRLYPGIKDPCHPYIFEHTHTTYKHSYLKVANCSAYSVSMSEAIWRKEFLQSCLVPGETAWQMENEGSDRLNERDGWNVWNVEDMEMFVANTVIKGRAGPWYHKIMGELQKINH